MIRFFSNGALDACSTESITLQPGELVLVWPETGIGERAVVSCPCGSIDTGLGVFATRMCNGDFTGPGTFGQGDTSQCTFDSETIELCRITEVSLKKK